MNTLRKYILTVAFVYISLYNTVAQTNTSPNLDFSFGDFTNWTAFTWLNTGMPNSLDPAFSRQRILSAKAARDPYTKGALKILPKGYRYVCRLGSDSGGDIKGGWNQSLRYTINVDLTKTLLVLKYAVVLNYAVDDGHT
jgi:hypothetical protein